MTRTLIPNSAVKVALAIAFATLSSCNMYKEPHPPRDRIHFPISIGVHPSGKYIYVVNSNFDSRYEEELGGTISVIDTETGKINLGGSPFVSSFGGMIRVNQTGTKAYVPTRYGDTVTVYDISRNGSSLSCPGEDGAPSVDPTNCEIGQLSTDDDSNRTKIGRSPYDIAVDTHFYSAKISGVDANHPLQLATSAIATQTFHGDPATVAANVSKLAGLTASVDGATIVIKPSPGFVAPLPVAIFPQENQKVTYDADDAVFVSSMESNQVSTLFLPKQMLSKIEMKSTSSNYITGGVGKRPFSKDILVVQRRGPSLMVFQPNFSRSEIKSIFTTQDLVLSHHADHIYGRGITFDPTGTTAYVLTQQPSALNIIKVVSEPVDDASQNGATAERYLLTNVIPLKRSPSSIVYHDTPAGPRLYITCTYSQAIMVLDANSGAVVDEILLGDTPSQFVVNEPRCKNNPADCVGYVALYDDTPNGEDTCSTAKAGQCGSVGVIDLNLSSPTFNQLVRKFE